LSRTIIIARAVKPPPEDCQQTPSLQVKMFSLSNLFRAMKS
jgi:hypothetical protein